MAALLCHRSVPLTRIFVRNTNYKSFLSDTTSSKRLLAPISLRHYSQGGIGKDTNKVTDPQQDGLKNNGDRENEGPTDPYAPFPDDVNPITGEKGGPRGPEPTRYGDWERKGRCIDF